jgi:membrane fusion protein, multidrug efflux system
MNRWRVLLGMAAVSVALVAIDGCSKGGQEAQMTMPPAPVIVSPVSTADVPVYLDEIGKASATAVVTVLPQVNGKLIKQDFVDGSDLTAGQKLFEIDPRPFQAELDAAQAAVEQTQATVVSAKQDFDRVASLLATKAVAQQDYDDKQSAYAVAVANEKAAEAALETARLNLEYCTITSPIDGRAGQRLVDAGSVVNENSTQLLVIETVKPIYADFTVPENELDRVRQNMADGTLAVEVRSPTDPNHPGNGQLIFLDNAVQDGTGTVKLRALLPNTDNRFWPGQFVQVRLILKLLHNALLVPNEAVQIGQQGPYVFVIKSDGTAEQRDVTPGQRQGDDIVIETGLNAGESVVKSGQLAVIPGLPVKVLNPTTQPAGGAGGTAAVGAGSGDRS